MVQEMGCRCSLAINPLTLVEMLLAAEASGQLLCMSVNPGFMGQPFIIEVLEKVRLAQLIGQEPSAIRHLHRRRRDGRDRRPCVTSGANQSWWAAALRAQDAAEAVRLLRARANEVGAGG